MEAYLCELHGLYRSAGWPWAWHDTPAWILDAMGLIDHVLHTEAEYARNRRLAGGR